MKKFFILLSIFSIFSGTALAESYKIKKGDTLSILLANKYNPSEIASIGSKIKKIDKSFVFRVGGNVIYNKDNVTLSDGIEKDIIISQGNNQKINVALKKYKQEVMDVLVKGQIKTNLFDSLKRSGEDVDLAAMLAGIFEWEIDFFKDLRVGDKYAVLVEKRFVRNKYVGYGKILAADFYNGGKLKRAVYFEEGKTKGYYNEDGMAMERGFLKAPLKYIRVSSPFSPRRLHPIFKQYRPHYGVDYAAPMGTPVMASASGVVEKMSYGKGNGNFIELSHGNCYKTFYLHLNGFNRAIKVGSTVNQGQIIGYVGETGYATGPHLDYRIKKSGHWINPQTFVAYVHKLKKNEKKDFYKFADSKLRVLDEAFPMYAQSQTSLPDNTIYPIEF